MKLFRLVLLLGLFSSLETVNALTLGEIIKLKQSGVSDETIQLLIRRDSDYRPSATWKTKDGWIIYSNEFRYHRNRVEAEYQNYYPVEIYPQVFSRRHWR
jgi:hypothetical protein